MTGVSTKSKIVYLIYQYSPKLYYEKVKNTWTFRLGKDQADLVTATNKLNNLNILKSNLES